MLKEKIYYLAHPIAGDEKFTYEQNMEHVVHMLRLCLEEGYACIAPYHTLCLAQDDTNPVHRAQGMEINIGLLHKLGGYVITTGHKVSRGMVVELDHATDVISLVGMNDEQARQQLRK